MGTFNINTFVEVALIFADKQSHIRHDEELLKAFSFFDESMINWRARRKWLHSRNRAAQDNELLR
jgi:hypothetical protein